MLRRWTAWDDPEGRISQLTTEACDVWIDPQEHTNLKICMFFILAILINLDSQVLSLMQLTQHFASQ